MTWKTAIKICLVSSGVFTLILSGLFVIWLDKIGIFATHDELLDSVVKFRSKDNTLVFDRHESKIGEVFDRYHVYVPYQHLPKDLVSAIVAIEDRRFFDHKGIDIRGIARAALARLKGSSWTQGASTLTQQLVRHFFLTRERTFKRKIVEAVLAIKLETRLSKESILGLYANVLFLGNGSYGVGAAAQRYFGRDLSSLETHELALIAGLFQSPSRYNPHRFPQRAKRRQHQVLLAMAKNKMITARAMREYMAKPLRYKKYRSLNHAVAPYFLDYVRDRAAKILGKSILNRGLRIYTTLDSQLQAMGDRTIKEKNDIFTFAAGEVLKPFIHRDADPQIEGALLSMNPKTGEILTMVGGRSYRRSKFNRTTQAKRQPGSAFKPVIYAMAIGGGMKWSDMIYVSPVAVDRYRPKNYKESFLTEVTLLKALYKSINTPVVEIGAKLGIQNVIDFAKNMGIESPIRKETGSLLGSSEATMMDLLRVYSTIGNRGVRVEPIAITRITDWSGKVLYEAKSITERSREVLSEQDAFLMVEGLKSVFRFGTAYAETAFSAYAAGKTGTSNGSRDNWFIGFTPQLAAAVWVGSDKSFEFLGKVTGTSTALPIWAHYMRKAAKAYPPTPFYQPPGVVEHMVDASYGHRSEGGVKMYFKEGEEPERSSSDLKVLSERAGYRTLFEN